MKKPQPKAPRKKPSLDPRQKINTLLDYLDSAIEAGEFQEGDQLPSRRMLAERFGLHPTSVSIALKKLAEHHPIRFIAGKGAFISSKAASESLSIGLLGRWKNLAAAFSDPVANYYHGPILHGLLETAEHHHHTIIILPHNHDKPLDTDRFTPHKLDCVISFMDNLDEDTVYNLRKQKTPLLHAHRDGEALTHLGVSYVDLDHITAIRETVQLFARHNHQQIGAVFSRSHDTAWESWRDTFILEAVKNNLLIGPDYIRIIDRFRPSEPNTPRPLHKEFAALLDLTPAPTAIYCCSPREQEEVFKEEAAQRGLVIGKDISLIFIAPQWMEPQIPYSMWSFNLKQIGRELIETAIKLAHDPDHVFNIDIPLTFIDKGSVATQS